MAFFSNLKSAVISAARNNRQNRQRRKEYGQSLREVSNLQLVFADESGLNLHSASRTYGWAPAGMRPCNVVIGDESG